MSSSLSKLEEWSNIFHIFVYLSLCLSNSKIWIGAVTLEHHGGHQCVVVPEPYLWGRQNSGCGSRSWGIHGGGFSDSIKSFLEHRPLAQERKTEDRPFCAQQGWDSVDLDQIKRVLEGALSGTPEPVNRWWTPNIVGIFGPWPSALIGSAHSRVRSWQDEKQHLLFLGPSQPELNTPCRERVLTQSKGAQGSWGLVHKKDWEFNKRISIPFAERKMELNQKVKLWMVVIPTSLCHGRKKNNKQSHS